MSLSIDIHLSALIKKVVQKSRAFVPTIPKAVIGHIRIPKAELDNEESDAGSYTSTRSMDGEEMKNNSNDFDFKHYVSEEEYDIENPPFCFCGRVAKRRMSRAAKNPGRWFFNCAKKNFNTQCGYFDEHKPHIGLDGSILSLAPPGSLPV
ncbi:hypothetical protein Leryth_026482 [Lithospermum erythrorhizon]|nr:hypothetical protein Leryth_026482 [Lithospermum erythrorhizon]